MTDIVVVLTMSVTLELDPLHSSTIPQSSYWEKLLPALLTICGIGAMGVGIFPANLQPMHSVFTLLAILFGALAAIGSYTYQTKPMSIISAGLGLMSLVLALIFIPYLGLPFGSTETFMGMAKGSLERWAINPILAWIIAFGSYLLGTASKNEN